MSKEGVEADEPAETAEPLALALAAAGEAMPSSEALKRASRLSGPCSSEADGF